MARKDLPLSQDSNASIVHNPRALKHLLDAALLERMAAALAQVHPSFSSSALLGVGAELVSLELKPRVQHIRRALRELLPEAYPAALKILLASTQVGSLRGFDLWPYSDFVQNYGLDDPTRSLKALKKLTPLFTSEFAVRPFLQHHPELTLAFLERCAKDKDVHVRRWASEGSRPRLPWGERLQGFVQDPSPNLALIEPLKFDPELYVRKSVANHLNDIAKDHPQQVIAVLRRWQKAASTADEVEAVTWITRHALRTLIKAGQPAALRLMGVGGASQLKCSGFKINAKEFWVGDKIDFALKIRSLSAKPQKVIVDYTVHFVKANKALSPRVFKWKTLVLQPHAELVLSKTHQLKEVSTRVLYAGTHLIEVQVNGVQVGRQRWQLNL